MDDGSSFARALKNNKLTTSWTIEPFSVFAPLRIVCNECSKFELDEKMAYLDDSTRQLELAISTVE